MKTEIGFYVMVKPKNWAWRSEYVLCKARAPRKPSKLARLQALLANPAALDEWLRTCDGGS